MLERWITALQIEAAGIEESSATRERLKELFPRGATRRMTQLGLLVGATLEPLKPTENDTIIYASSYAETRALEGYLDSFPSASPTLFQTSIHPSAVQQSLILRQQAVHQFFPMTGNLHLPAQALQVALLAETPRSILCGGEERGTWLLERGTASAISFAFSLALSTAPDGAIGRLTLTGEPDEKPAANAHLTLPDFFEILRSRRSFDGRISPSQRLTLVWS